MTNASATMDVADTCHIECAKDPLTATGSLNADCKATVANTHWHSRTMQFTP